MKYPFHVTLTQEENENYWVAKSDTLKGCIGVGDTPDEAVNELSENEIGWLEAAAEAGIPIPSVPIEKYERLRKRSPAAESFRCQA